MHNKTRINARSGTSQASHQRASGNPVASAASSSNPAPGIERTSIGPQSSRRSQHDAGKASLPQRRAAPVPLSGSVPGEAEQEILDSFAERAITIALEMNPDRVDYSGRVPLNRNFPDVAAGNIRPTPVHHFDEQISPDRISETIKMDALARREFLHRGGLIVRNSGRGLNCLIIALLQHATRRYNTKNERELAQLAAGIRETLGFPPSQMLYSDDPQFEKLVEHINNNFTQQPLDVVLAQAHGPGTFMTIRPLEPPLGKRRSVLLLQSVDHYEAVLGEAAFGSDLIAQPPLAYEIPERRRKSFSMPTDSSVKEFELALIRAFDYPDVSAEDASKAMDSELQNGAENALQNSIDEEILESYATHPLVEATLREKLATKIDALHEARRSKHNTSQPESLRKFSPLPRFGGLIKARTASRLETGARIEDVPWQQPTPIILKGTITVTEQRKLHCPDDFATDLFLQICNLLEPNITDSITSKSNGAPIVLDSEGLPGYLIPPRGNKLPRPTDAYKLKSISPSGKAEHPTLPPWPTRDERESLGFADLLKYEARTILADDEGLGFPMFAFKIKSPDPDVHRTLRRVCGENLTENSAYSVFECRIGAHQLLQALNNLKLSPGLLAATAASLAVSSALTYAMDQRAIPALIQQVANSHDLSSAQRDTITAILGALTPLLTESSEWMFVRTILSILRTGKLLTRDQFFHAAKEGLKGGAIAALGSIPGNALGLRQFNSFSYIPLRMIANALAFGSASFLLSSELENSRLQLKFLTWSEDVNGTFYSSRLTEPAIAGLGIGFILSQIGAIAKGRVYSIFEGLLNVPAETLSLTAAVAMSTIGIPWVLLSGQKARHQRVVELILKKTVERLEGEQTQVEESELQTLGNISEDELYRAEHRPLEFWFPIGATVQRVTNYPSLAAATRFATGKANEIVNVLANLFTLDSRSGGAGASEGPESVASPA